MVPQWCENFPIMEKNRPALLSSRPPGLEMAFSLLFSAQTIYTRTAESTRHHKEVPCVFLPYASPPCCWCPSFLPPCPPLPPRTRHPLPRKPSPPPHAKRPIAVISKGLPQGRLPPCNLQGMHQGFHLGSGSSRGRLPSLQGLPRMLNLLPGRKPSKPSSRQGVQRQGGTETANHSPGRSIAATGCSRKAAGPTIPQV